jgi:hypothetical protein
MGVREFALAIMLLRQLRRFRVAKAQALLSL